MSAVSNDDTEGGDETIRRGKSSGSNARNQKSQVPAKAQSKAGGGEGRAAESSAERSVADGSVEGVVLFAPADSKPVQKKSDVVAHIIVSEIVENQLPAGARLPVETKMLEQLGVGRATLREALRILETQGLVRIVQGPAGGPVVAAATSQNFGRMSTLFYQMQGATLGELIEARLMIEPMMARIAATRPSRESGERLQYAIDLAERAAVDDDRAWQRASVVFHEVIAGLSGNRILDLFGESLKDVWFDKTKGTVYAREDRKRVRDDHVAVAKAVLDGDADQAQELMRAHMQEFRDHVLSSHRGLLDEVVDWR